MPLSTTVNIDTTNALRILRGVRGRAADFSLFFDQRVDPDVVMFFRKQFASEGTEGGTPWKPLRPTTIKLKRAAGRARMGVLRFSNELWASLTKRAGPKVVKIVTPRQYTRGTAVQSSGTPYPALHQEGYSIDTVFGRRMQFPRVVPARPLVPKEMPTSYVNRWQSLAAKFIETGMV